MKALMAVALAAIGGIACLCLAVDKPAGAKIPQPTNTFSDWVGVSSNLTVKTRALPWSGSRVSRAFHAKAATQPPAVSQQSLRLAQQRLDEELAKRTLELKRERLLNAAPYTETFHVHLSRTNRE
jgi:hypothetical protein